MIYLSQRNPYWADKKLGASDLTIGKFGCTTTCISMLSDYFGCFKTPAEIAAFVANYTPSGLILWNKLHFKRMMFTWREYKYNEALIDKALKDPNTAIILNVNNGQHWVVAIRKTWFGLGSDYLCVDPWTGKTCYAKKAYHNITGSATFTRI